MSVKQKLPKISLKAKINREETEQQILEGLLTKQKWLAHGLKQTFQNMIIVYDDIFSSNIVKQQQVTELYMLGGRNNILNSLPVDTAGPMPCFAKAFYIITY